MLVRSGKISIYELLFSSRDKSSVYVRFLLDPRRLSLTTIRRSRHALTLSIGEQVT